MLSFTQLNRLKQLPYSFLGDHFGSFKHEPKIYRGGPPGLAVAAMDVPKISESRPLRSPSFFCSWPLPICHFWISYFCSLNSHVGCVLVNSPRENDDFAAQNPTSVPDPELWFVAMTSFHPEVQLCHFFGWTAYVADIVYISSISYTNLAQWETWSCVIIPESCSHLVVSWVIGDPQIILIYRWDFPL